MPETTLHFLFDNWVRRIFARQGLDRERVVTLYAATILAAIIPAGANAQIASSDCDAINLLTDYGVVGQTDFTYGNNSEINGNDITGNGNTPTPSGVTENVNLDFPPFNPATFPATGGSNLTDPTPATIAAGSYGRIRYDGPLLTFTGGDYFISELSIENGSTVQLAPGNYFIDTLAFENTTELLVSPAGAVNIFVGNSFQAGNRTAFNVPGDTADLIFFLYPGTGFQVGNADNRGAAVMDFNGIIYAPYPNTQIQFGNNTQIAGAILSAGQVDVGNNTDFDYSDAIHDSVNEALGCQPGVAIHHYAIAHSGIGVTCEAETITITAHDATHAPLVPAAGTTISFSTSLANDGWGLLAGNGSFLAPNQYRFDGLESSVQLLLRRASPTTDPHMDIDVSDGTASDLDDGTEEDPRLEFRDSALRFYADGVNNTIGPQIARKSSAAPPGDQLLTLRAVQTNTDNGACEGRVNGPQTVQMRYRCINPGTCKDHAGVTISDASASVSTVIGDGLPGTDVALIFDASGTATWRLSYTDAGLIELHASLFIAAVDEQPAITLTGTSNAFVSKPAGFCISAPDASSACPGADIDCSVFRRAGEAFGLQVQAMAWQTAGETNTDFCSGNLITPNFALNGIALNHALVAPAGGVIGGLDITSFDMALAGDGETLITAQRQPEVGVFNFTVAPPDYLGEPLAMSTSANVGRFIPDHFRLSAGVLTHRSDLACLSDFTYLGENFRVSYNLSAHNVPGDVTQNYIGAFARLNSPVELNYAAADTDTTGAPQELTPRLALVAGSVGFVAGQTSGLAHTMRLDRLTSDADGPFALRVGIAPLDEDGVALRGADLDLDSDGDGIVDRAAIQASPASFRFGRLLISNAHGSELIPLDVGLRTQYFDRASETFVGSDADHCTTYDASAIDLAGASYSGDLTAGDLAVSGLGTLVAGGALFTLHDNADSSLGPGASGTVDYMMTVPPWLQFDWDGDGIFTDNPGARATFGIFNGDARQIYYRQIYR